MMEDNVGLLKAKKNAENTLLQVVETCIDNTKFASYFFSNHFHKPFAPFHMELHDMADRENFLAIAAPRGHAKTTAFTFLKPMKAIAYRLNRFIIIVSDTYEQACLFLEDIQNEFERNTAYTTIYKLQVTQKKEDRLVINNEMMIRAMGAGQKFRGLKFRHWRPDLIIADDIENDEMVENPQRREKLRKWFWGALYPMRAENGRVVVIGTILHEDSLLARLLKDPLFFGKLYQIVDNNNQPLWPARYSLEDIAKLRTDYEKRHQLTTFYQEYFNVATSPENRKFQLHWLNRFELKELERPNMLKVWPKFIHVDLAHDDEAEKSENAFHAISVTAYNPDTDSRYILETIRFKEDFDELVKTFFEKVDQWGPFAVSIETVGAQKHFYQHVRNEMRRRGKRFILIPLPHTKAKHYRIMTMQYPMQIGKYFLHRGHTENFEIELQRYPKCEYFDEIDATAQLEEVIDKLNLVKTVDRSDRDGDQRGKKRKRFKSSVTGGKRLPGGKHGATGY